MSNAPTEPELIKDFPEIIKAVRFDKRPRKPVAIGTKNFYEEGIFYADDSVFEQFSFQLQKGDPRTALSQPYSVVMTEEMAEKYFGEQEPIGKVLRFNDKNDFTVTGVMSNVPENSHFTFDFLCSFETLYEQNPDAMDVWMRFNYYTYLQLKDGTNPEELERKFPGFVKTYMEDQLKQMGGSMDFFLQPLTSIHLNSHLQGEISANSSIWYVYIFSVVGILIILIACINFMNLSTARSGERAKEVGVRKVLGASKGQLVKQFLGESIVLLVCARWRLLLQPPN